jgi:hypothetical protein
MIVSNLLTFSLSTHAAPTVTKTYVIKSGEGWAVCEAYANALNALPPEADFPYCNFTELGAAGISLPTWETLEVEANLPLLHQIELAAWNSYDYESDPTDGKNRFKPSADFATWKVQRLDRIRQLQQLPRLRRVRMALIENGQSETLLAYDGDIHACQKVEQREFRRFGHRVGEAPSPMKRLLNESTGQLIGEPGWDIAVSGEIVMHQQRPYLVLPYGIPGNIPEVVISRFEHAVEDRSEFRAQGRSGYLIRELCRIERTSPLSSPLFIQPYSERHW